MASWKLAIFLKPQARFLISSILLLIPSVTLLVIRCLKYVSMFEIWFLKVYAALIMGFSLEWVAHQNHDLKNFPALAGYE